MHSEIESGLGYYKSSQIRVQVQVHVAKIDLSPDSSPSPESILQVWAVVSYVLLTCLINITYLLTYSVTHSLTHLLTHLLLRIDFYSTALDGHTTAVRMSTRVGVESTSNRSCNQRL